MSFVKSILTNFRKEYVIKWDDEICIKLDPSNFFRYKEGNERKFEWKWLQLPMNMKNRYINKLMFFNLTEKKVTLKVLIRYDTERLENLPFIYYSPTREAIIFFDYNGYRLFGGVAECSINEKYSTVSVDLEKWKKGASIPIQPLTNGSDGWAMEFTLPLNPNGSNYLYEWEFSNDKLHKLEEIHAHYQQLLKKEK